MATNTVGKVVISLLAITITTAQAYCPDFMKNKDSPCTCFAYSDGAVIKCTGNEGPATIEKMKAIPQTSIIKELIIENANIVEIGPRAFRNLRIKSLKLDHNRIKSIHPDAFRGLELGIESLSLAHNKLTQVPTDALTGMRKLTVLNLKCNNIGDIFGMVFRNVTNLIELNLACNQICQIEGPAFDAVANSLQSLILDQNCMKAIPGESLKGFRQLLALHMQYNQITEIKGMNVVNLESLIMIRLTGNQIQTMDKMSFKNIPNLRYLYLDNNKLTTVEPDALKKFKYLEIVDMSHNLIAEVPANAFQGLEKLMQLKLEGNMIRDIAPGAFSNTPLLILLLGRNCLSSISRPMFQGVVFLRQLSLSGNSIRQIQPFSFTSLPNLHILDLSHNRLQSVQMSSLTASSHVTVLLQENPIVCSQAGFHIVQGGQPIRLLSETNEVCSQPPSALLNNATGDVCPTKRPKLEVPVCCEAYEETTVAPTTLRSLALSTVVTAKPARRKGGRAVNRITQSVEITTPVPGVSTKGNINMERFWRLQNRSKALANRRRRLKGIVRRGRERLVKALNTRNTVKPIPPRSSTTPASVRLAPLPTATRRPPFRLSATSGGVRNSQQSGGSTRQVTPPRLPERFQPPVPLPPLEPRDILPPLQVPEIVIDAAGNIFVPEPAILNQPGQGSQGPDLVSRRTASSRGQQQQRNVNVQLPNGGAAVEAGSVRLPVTISKELARLNNNQQQPVDLAPPLVNAQSNPALFNRQQGGIDTRIILDQNGQPRTPTAIEAEAIRQSLLAQFRNKSVAPARTPEYNPNQRDPNNPAFQPNSGLLVGQSPPPFVDTSTILGGAGGSQREQVGELPPWVQARLLGDAVGATGGNSFNFGAQPVLSAPQEQQRKLANPPEIRQVLKQPLNENETTNQAVSSFTEQQQQQQQQQLNTAVVEGGNTQKVRLLPVDKLEIPTPTQTQQRSINSNMRNKQFVVPTPHLTVPQSSSITTTRTEVRDVPPVFAGSKPFTNNGQKPQISFNSDDASDQRVVSIGAADVPQSSTIIRQHHSRSTVHHHQSSPPKSVFTGTAQTEAQLRINGDEK